MLRDILSGSRAILVGVVFFVLVVGGSLLYSWHVHHTTDAEVARSDVLLQQRENESRSAVVTFEAAGFVNTDEENEDPESLSEDTEGALDETELTDVADVFLQEDFVSEVEAPTEEVPVSPYGFGPYPEVPDGFSKIPPWLWSEEKRQNFGGSLKDMELIYRVLIKLWNQEDRDWVGAKLDDQNGKVYPLYRNIIYVDRWIEIPVEGGEIMQFPAGGASGGSDWKPDIEAFAKSGGKIPGHIQFIDRDTAGYNPYEFLNLR